MIAICSKFGTSGFGVAVGEGLVVGVCIGIEVEVGRALAAGVGGKAVCVTIGALKQDIKKKTISGAKK